MVDQLQDNGSIYYNPEAGELKELRARNATAIWFPIDSAADMEYSIIRILIMEVGRITSAGALTERLAWLFLEWRRHMQRRLTGYDISLPQLSLLAELGRHEFLLPSRIADHLHCDRPTASVVIRNLEKKGLIDRKKNKDNARYHHIYLSEKGREYLAQINASVPPVTVSPFDALTPEENEQLYHLLKKCCDRVKEITDQKENGNECNIENDPESALYPREFYIPARRG